MKNELIIEKISQKYCWSCRHFKKTVPGHKKKKLEISCEEYMRLKSLVFHPTITLNFIDKKALTCSNFSRSFKI